MKIFTLSSTIVLSIMLAFVGCDKTNSQPSISTAEITTPEAAVAELVAGNNRFANSERVRTLLAAQDTNLRDSLVNGQSPFAVIVSCSDSRVADSYVFDQELGRLFSIRTAGNSPDILGIASIEYAVEHCHSKVVVVMGHTKCGAISAVADAKGEKLPDNLYIFQNLMPGLLTSVTKEQGEDDAAYKDRLEIANAKRQAQNVYERSKIVQEAVEHGHILLLPASYDITTGKVTFFDQIGGTGEHQHQH